MLFKLTGIIKIHFFKFYIFYIFYIYIITIFIILLFQSVPYKKLNTTEYEVFICKNR